MIFQQQTNSKQMLALCVHALLSQQLRIGFPLFVFIETPILCTGFFSLTTCAKRDEADSLYSRSF